MTKVIDWSHRFKRDYKRESKTFGKHPLEKMCTDCFGYLVEGLDLPERYKDHSLAGEWEGCRECHIKPDLLLIYETSDEVVTLYRLGSHSELFGG